MFKLTKSRLGVFFTVGVSTILSIAMLSFAFISIRLIHNFGQSVTVLNEKTIRQQTKRLLERGTYAQAGRYSAVFQKAASLTSLLAREAGVILNRIDFYGCSDINPNETFKLYPNGVYSNSASEKLNVIYFGGGGITPPIKMQIRALSHLDPLLIKAEKSDPMYIGAWIMTEDGVVRYFPNDHYVDILPPIDEFDYFGDHYYAIATPGRNPARKTVWTKIYEDITGKGLMTTASTPVYDDNGTFRGVAGIDITLDVLLSIILGHGSAPDSVQQFKNEFTFLIDHNGDLISMPPEKLEIFGLPSFDPTSFQIGQLLAINMRRSILPEIRHLAETMLGRTSGIRRLDIGGSPHIIAFHQMPATEWILAVAIPEYDLLASVNTTRETLKATVSDMSTNFLWLSILFLLVTIGGTLVLFNRRLMRPIQALIRFTRVFSKGNRNERIHLKEKGEIGDLATAFNEMADDLENTTVSRDTLAEEISERKEIQKAMERRVEFEHLISEISANLAGLGLTEIDIGIDRALALIGAFTGVDRAYVFIVKESETAMDNTHEWCADGIQTQIDDLQNIILDQELPWIAAQLRNRTVFDIADVDALPEEAKRDQEHFQAQGIKSIVFVPMKMEDRIIGLIGFDAVSRPRTWTREDKTVLRLIGETFANVIMRKRTEEELRKSEEKLRAEVEARLQKEKALASSEKRFRSIFEESRDAIISTDKDWYVNLMNPAGMHLFGLSNEDLKSVNFKEFYVDHTMARKLSSAIDDSGYVRDFDVQLKGKDEKPMDCLMTIHAKRGSDGNLAGYEGIVRDVSAYKRMEQELWRLATTDPLTGINNRRNFTELAEKEIDRSSRYGRPFSLIMLDIDYFKSINDSYGHSIGDQVLCDLCDLCLNEIRESDIMGRLGGEEFAIALVESPLKAAEIISKRIKTVVSSHVFSVDNEDIRFTVSLGITELGENDTLDSILERADNALYDAKKNGRNQVKTHPS